MTMCKSCGRKAGHVEGCTRKRGRGKAHGGHHKRSRESAKTPNYVRKDVFAYQVSLEDRGLKPQRSKEATCRKFGIGLLALENIVQEGLSMDWLDELGPEPEILTARERDEQDDLRQRRIDAGI